jgi:hypothetical protein
MSNEEAEQFMEWVKARVPQPKREWVGLTEEEVDDIIGRSKLWSTDVARLTEEKLKEKNGG